MVFRRPGWSDGAASIVNRAFNVVLTWRPGFYDDFFGFGVTVAEPSDRAFDAQTIWEAFNRFDLSDNVAITGDLRTSTIPV